MVDDRPMTIGWVNDAGEVTVSLSGRLDTRSCADVRLALHGVIDEGYGPIRLDLGDCLVGDPTALGLLVEALRRARRRDREVRVLHADPRTQRWLRRARLGDDRGQAQTPRAPARALIAVGVPSDAVSTAHALLAT